MRLVFDVEETTEGELTKVVVSQAPKEITIDGQSLNLVADFYANWGYTKQAAERQLRELLKKGRVIEVHIGPRISFYQFA